MTAEADLAQILGQLTALGSTPQQASLADAEVLANARQMRAGLEARLEGDNQAFDSATSALSELETTVAHVRTEIASKQGELKAIDRPTLESKRKSALENSVFQVPEIEGISFVAAVEAFEGLKRKLEECDGRLNAAKGQLHLVAGHVGAEQLAQHEEAVKYASDEVIDREQNEKAALYLLKAIQEAEAARTSHLGRTLAGPITETFRALTGGRYGQLGLDPDLRTHSIAAAGAHRDVSELSVGTREQLATLIRLAIAAHLKTALILDDQLVHSDEERLRWFREKLRASASEHDHQVIVFTCRPADYLQDEAMATTASSVSVVDLYTAISSVTPLSHLGHGASVQRFG
jgi:DNA repair exonuclease SbcCD ATPase subunit